MVVFKLRYGIRQFFSLKCLRHIVFAPTMPIPIVNSSVHKYMFITNNISSTFVLCSIDIVRGAYKSFVLISSLFDMHSSEYGYLFLQQFWANINVNDI